MRFNLSPIRDDATLTVELKAGDVLCVNGVDYSLSDYSHSEDTYNPKQLPEYVTDVLYTYDGVLEVSVSLPYKFGKEFDEFIMEVNSPALIFSNRS